MPITDKTRKLLWARAGNRCAICQRRLIEAATSHDDPSIVGDECHVVSKASGGPRHDPFFTGDPDDYENLLLLCKADHKMVDDQTGTYSVEKLKLLKAQHEAAVEGALASHFEPSQTVITPTLRGFDNFRTTIWFLPDQPEALLKQFQQYLTHDGRLNAYGKVGTGFKSNPTGRYAAWVQAFLPVSPKLLNQLAAEVGVCIVDVGHERLPGVYRVGSA